jgi:hypothetical protein
VAKPSQNSVEEILYWCSVDKKKKEDEEEINPCAKKKHQAYAQIKVRLEVPSLEPHVQLWGLEVD